MPLDRGCHRAANHYRSAGWGRLRLGWLCVRPRSDRAPASLWCLRRGALSFSSSVSISNAQTRPAGKMFGRRPAMLTCLGLFALGSALCGSAQNMSWLIAARSTRLLPTFALGKELTMTTFPCPCPLTSLNDRPFPPSRAPINTRRRHTGHGPRTTQTQIPVTFTPARTIICAHTRYT